MALRWGIVSAGKISHDFAVALSTLPASDHKLVAIAARQKDRAEEFAKTHDIPNAFGSYKELAAFADVGEYLKLNRNCCRATNFKISEKNCYKKYL